MHPFSPRAPSPRAPTSPGRWVVRALIALALIGLAVIVSAVVEFARSRAVLDGERPLAGLSAAATIERDALGTATIRAASRGDALRALGFVHAQERYFEMDLTRRQAAGELAALLGPRLLDSDRRIRAHRLRARAGSVVAALPDDQRVLLRGYVDGVNAGLAALPTRPWTYRLLRQQPTPWTEADSILVVHAMYAMLANIHNTRELGFDQIRTHSPPALAALIDAGLGDQPFAFSGSDWDAPLDGEALPAPRLPRADEVDIRTLDPALFGRDHEVGGDLVAGSNAFALGGARTLSGRGALQNDMHLGLGVPGIWFRARLEYPAAASGAAPIALTGVTLPGVPGIVAGSNGRVAWGFTNSYVDAGDWVIVRFADQARERYCLASGAIESASGTSTHCTASAALIVHTETIDVAGAVSESLAVRETRWGPLVAKDASGNELASAWIGHDPAAVNLALVDFDRVSTADEALALGATLGMPPQNLIVVDASGNVGWTLTGLLPRRQGFFPRAPADWSQAPQVGWVGWLRPDEHPRRLNPPSGAIWTANARTVGGAELARLGDGGYALGARAAQIRDALLETQRGDARALLDIALDDRALFLSRWRDLLLATIDANAGDAALQSLKPFVVDWGGRAAIDSVGYRAVRTFRREVASAVADGLTGPVRAKVADFELPKLEQLEAVLWRMLEDEPVHLLAPIYADYAALKREAALRIVDQWRAAPGGIAARTWGEANTTRIQHPLARAVPALSPFLDMPREALAGDAFMPRVQGPAFGASERMAVEPGAEAAGYFHMPGGQSGHPWSPFYGAGHDDWARGAPSPFLPGAVAHTLELSP